jgi:hypothetical protein
MPQTLLILFHCFHAIFIFFGYIIYAAAICDAAISRHFHFSPRHAIFFAAITPFYYAADPLIFLSLPLFAIFITLPLFSLFHYFRRCCRHISRFAIAAAMMLMPLSADGLAIFIFADADITIDSAIFIPLPHYAADCARCRHRRR